MQFSLSSPSDDAVSAPKAAEVISLISAACAAWLACPAPLPITFPLGTLGLIAVRYLLLVCAAAAAVICVQAARSPLRGKALRRRTLGVQASACWLAPIGILLARESVWAVPVSMVFAIWLASAWRTEPIEPEEAPDQALSFSLLPDRRGALLPALSTAALLHGSAVAGAMGSAGAGSLLAGAGTAVLWMNARSARLGTAGRIPPEVTSISAVLVAALITFTTLLPYLRADFRADLGDAGNPGAERGGETEDFPQMDPERMAERARTAVLDDTYAGVILWPEAKKHATIVPPIPSMRRELLSGKAIESKPLTIPFFGVYYLFKAPHTRPPRDSHVERGRPDRKTFRSTDRRPLFMEAHQNLGAPVSILCCSEIQVAVSNADKFSGTVRVELILADTTSTKRPIPSVSLGIAEVISTPRWSPAGAGQPLAETLSFAMPAAPAFDRFDAVKIRFHLGPIRNDRSAKVAIERFVLVPRL